MEEEAEFELTRLDRYHLSNQLRIMEALYPDEADDIAVQREAIENGYELLYRWQMDHISSGDSVMTPDECMEVWDTLDMFDAIDRSIKELERPELREHFAAIFRGYDGNNEGKFLTFTAYTVERLKRFEYVPVANKGTWNSHSPVREMYLRMLTVWQGIGRASNHSLSEEELASIFEASRHPDSRE